MRPSLPIIPIRAKPDLNSVMLNLFQHPPLDKLAWVRDEAWTLKQVQGDGKGKQ
ncbi:MAG: hypothetical protein R3D99_06050 [Altererythrobacter sp.]